MSSVWGKILGGFFGYSLAGPLGAIFGILVGGLFDRGFNAIRSGSVDPHSIRGETRKVFNEITFSVMGHIAKADGRISEDEIEIARETMRTLKLNISEQREAIRAFTDGKAEDFQLGLALTELKQVCRQQPSLLKMFVEIQYRAVSAGSRRVDINKQKLVNTVFERLGFIPMFQTAQSSYSQSHSHSYSDFNYRQHQQRQHSYTPPPYVDELAEAYKTLDISERSTADEIKKAYRKKMSQHHPDKLIARGLSDSQVKQGTAQAQKIQAAYEKVRSSRGF